MLNVTLCFFMVGKNDCFFLHKNPSQEAFLRGVIWVVFGLQILVVRIGRWITNPAELGFK